MPKTTEQLAGSKAGETAETNGFGSQERPLRQSGVYELKNDDGKVVDTIIVKTHPKFGDSQAAAVERVGYRYARPAEKDEIKTIEVDAAHLATENRDGSVTSEDMKGVMARLSKLEDEKTALEKENADLKAGQRAEDESGAADGDVKTQAKQDAKDEAQTQLENRGQADPLSNDTEGDEGREKAFSQLNRAELEELAEEEGIELPAEADTNAKIREAITKARAEKESN